MSQLERIREKILKIKIVNKEEVIRYELYAIFTTIILSRELFNKNKDVVSFLDDCKIETKSYMKNNRSQILAKALKDINKAKPEDMHNYKKILSSIFFIEKNEQKTIKDDNYMESLLNRYSRSKR